MRFFFLIFEFARRCLTFFLFESGCVLPIVCVIAYGEMRGCFEYFEVVDGIAMIWLKGFAFCVILFEVGVRFD